MRTPILPNWVAPFCCVMPFCALLGFSVSGAFGASVSNPGLICLVVLCGKITGWVLNEPRTFVPPLDIEDGIRDQPRSRGLGDVYKRQLTTEHDKAN